MSRFIRVDNEESPKLINLDHITAIRVRYDDDAASVVAWVSDADHYYTLAECAPTTEGVFKAKHYIAELGKLWQRHGVCVPLMDPRYLDNTELHEGRLASKPCPDCGSRTRNDNCGACCERRTLR